MQRDCSEFRLPVPIATRQPVRNRPKFPAFSPLDKNFAPFCITDGKPSPKKSPSREATAFISPGRKSGEASNDGTSPEEPALSEAEGDGTLS
jgi:hypothetical protein